MKTIPLTRGKFAIVDDADFDWLNHWKWHCTANGYAARREGWKGKLIFMHRLIMNTPAGMEGDHINNNGCDNRRSNLRNCTPSQNKMNKSHQANNTLGVKGVTLHANGKYRAKIQVARKQVHLGYFRTLEQAASAYDEATQIYHGVFAKPNKQKGE